MDHASLDNTSKMGEARPEVNMSGVFQRPVDDPQKEKLIVEMQNHKIIYDTLHPAPFCTTKIQKGGF